MLERKKDREKALDQVQPLIDEKGRILRLQAETGKNYSAVLKDLDQRIKQALRGKK
ncbi:MAG: hypothetical protein GX559_02250 [Candidatus Pacebacteria bacterium]|nr:hypothetical protein [Candidatus Paceibacterota bacterium]